MALTEQIADTSRRVFYADSYALPQVSKTSYGFPVPAPGSAIGSYSVFVGPGATTNVNGVVSGAGATGTNHALGYVNVLAYSSGCGTVVLGYIDTFGVFNLKAVSSLPTSLSNFPASSLPLFAVSLDSASRIATLTDWRPRNNFGTATEVIADSTKRSNWIQSFEPCGVPKSYPASQPDAYGGNLVYVGPGAVSTGAQVVSWPGGNVRTSTITNGIPGFTQGYVDAGTGLVSTQFVTSSTAAFPAGSLPIFLATLDSTGRIVALSDQRPS